MIRETNPVRVILLVDLLHDHVDLVRQVHLHRLQQKIYEKTIDQVSKRANLKARFLHNAEAEETVAPLPHHVEVLEGSKVSYHNRLVVSDALREARLDARLDILVAQFEETEVHVSLIVCPNEPAVALVVDRVLRLGVARPEDLSIRGIIVSIDDAPLVGCVRAIGDTHVFAVRGR